MSVIRWGTDSDIYIFESVEREVICCGCHLMPKIPDSSDDSWYGFEYEHFTCNSLDGMIEHVRKHITEKHLVPKSVIPELERRRDNPNWRDDVK